MPRLNTRFLQSFQNLFKKKGQGLGQDLNREAMEVLGSDLQIKAHIDLPQLASNFSHSLANVFSPALEYTEKVRSLLVGLIEIICAILSNIFGWSLALATYMSPAGRHLFPETLLGLLALSPLLSTIGVATWAFCLTHKTLPDVSGTLYSARCYLPILIPALIGIVLLTRTQASLLDVFHLLEPNWWLLVFLWLFSWKAVKIAVHTFSCIFLTQANLYRPVLPPHYPRFTPNDVSVIVPSVGDFGEEFTSTINSIIANQPGKIIVTTATRANLQKAQAACESLEKEANLYSGTIVVTAVSHPNKRNQFIHAIKKVETPITCYADDHVFWPESFLHHALAPFEDPLVGLVGTVKRVERVKTGSFQDRLLNYIAVMYLERHNFECTASYNIDGGVFVISGRTALTRTEIIRSTEFMQEFLNETWWWGTVGPMKVDDDNCITRFMVNNGYKTVFHNEPAVLMRTTIGGEGGHKKFSGQLIRWVRTTWRSNPTSLFADRKIWRAHPWTTYSMMISLFFNISLLYDPALFFTLWKAGFLREYWHLLALFLIGSKTIKQVPHLMRNPDDVWPFWIFGMLFGYYHSLIKIKALLTAKNIEWTGREFQIPAPL